MHRTVSQKLLLLEAKYVLKAQKVWFLALKRGIGRHCGLNTFRGKMENIKLHFFSIFAFL